MSKELMSNYTKIQFDIKKLGLKFDKRKLNSVVFHNTNESIEHFIAKCLLSFLLRSKGHDIYSEGKYGVKKLDVIDLTDKVVYEIESNKTNKKTQQKETNIADSYFELMVVDLKDMPNTFEGALNFIKKKIGF